MLVAVKVRTVVIDDWSPRRLVVGDEQVGAGHGLLGERRRGCR